MIFTEIPVKCERGCGAWLQSATDTLGRMIERCPKCDTAPPAVARGPSLVVTRPTIASPPRAMPDPVLRQSPSSPPAPRPADTPMPQSKKRYPKTCQRSGAEFSASGPAAKYCGTCDECVAAAESTATDPNELSQKRSAQSKGAKRGGRPAKRATPKRVTTGYRPPQAGAGDMSAAIGHLKLELESIDKRRGRIVVAIEQLEAIEAEASAA